MLLARINPVCGRAIERKRSCVCDLHDDIRIRREQRGHRTAACEQSCKRLQRNFLLHGVNAGVSRLYTSASGRERCPYPTVSCQGFCFHGAEEDAEIHPSTGYIPWSDAKQVCVNAEESYRGDTPDADCTGVRGKGGSCHSELPVILSCPYRDDNSISYISGIEERVSPLSVVPCEQYLHYPCSCVPDTASMILGISPVVLAVSLVVEP